MKGRFLTFEPSYNAFITHQEKNGQHIYHWKVYDTANGRAVARGTVTATSDDLNAAWLEADKAIRCAIVADAQTIKLQ